MATRQALDRAQAYLQLHTGALAAVLRALLAAQSHDETDLENVAHMQVRRELCRLNTRLPLHLIAVLAPLIGLLGTVVGMVKTLQQVATAEGAVNPISSPAVFGRPSSPSWRAWWWLYRP